MSFTNDTDLQKFINHEKYYKTLNNYCLGSNLVEAGEILSKIIKEYKEKKGK